MTIAGQETVRPDAGDEEWDWGGKALKETNSSISFEAYCQLNSFNKDDLKEIDKYNDTRMNGKWRIR